eukprot:365725-Chlamydomonas_euryale.AAC.49
MGKVHLRWASNTFAASSPTLAAGPRRGAPEAGRPHPVMTTRVRTLRYRTCGRQHRRGCPPGSCRCDPQRRQPCFVMLSAPLRRVHVIGPACPWDRPRRSAPPAAHLPRLISRIFSQLKPSRSEPVAEAEGGRRHPRPHE